MTHGAIAYEGAELMRHLLTDFVIKGVLVVGAVIALTTGMVVLWRKLG